MMEEMKSFLGGENCGMAKWRRGPKLGVREITQGGGRSLSSAPSMYSSATFYALFLSVSLGREERGTSPVSCNECELAVLACLLACLRAVACARRCAAERKEGRKKERKGGRKGK
jgi:hypothetical protein